MRVAIDLTSLLAGISLTAIGGWIASFLSLRKDERAVQVEQVTKERTKWRDDMRDLCEKIAVAYVESHDRAKHPRIASLRARLASLINPKDKADIDILEHYDRLFAGESKDFERFVRRISLLLKHDWERVKWECMPLYQKPFLRFTKKQRDWRRDDYRSVDS